MTLYFRIMCILFARYNNKLSYILVNQMIPDAFSCWISKEVDDFFFVERSVGNVTETIVVELFIVPFIFFHLRFCVVSHFFLNLKYYREFLLPRIQLNSHMHACVCAFVLVIICGGQGRVDNRKFSYLSIALHIENGYWQVKSGRISLFSFFLWDCANVI